jgi:hypothetical protein
LLFANVLKRAAIIWLFECVYDNSVLILGYCTDSQSSGYSILLMFRAKNAQQGVLAIHYKRKGKF